jgi:hypothetical protein
MQILSCGHHTIQKTIETIAHRTSAGPIKSLMKHPNGTPKKHPPFVGDGYYFWEDNIDAAT